MPIDNVLDVTPRVQYVASASQTAFDYPFPIFTDADLVVIVDGATKTLTTDYTVSGEGDDTGGTITFLSGQTAGAIVTIYRDIAIERTSDFQTNGPLSSETFNDELDRLTLVQQQLEAGLGRALRLPFDAEVTDAEAQLTVANFANKYLTFDADGVPTPALLSDTTMTQSTIGALLNPITPAEDDAGATPVSYAVVSHLGYNLIYPIRYSSDGTFAAITTANVQKAADLAASLVAASPDTVGDRVGGATVVISTRYNATEPVRIAESNVRLDFTGGGWVCVQFTSLTGYNIAKPVFIVGSAETWQTSGVISTTTKYNRIRGAMFKNDYDTATVPYIGILSSGTRNCTIEQTYAENAFAGLLMENTSELQSSQLSVIGSTYSIVGDNRHTRVAGSSVLNVACTDNDVSSNTFTGTTSYYSQHTGLLLLNCGRHNFYGGTIGLFSDNPTGGSPGLGFPSAYAGVHIYGGSNGNWTRGALFDGFTIEAPQNKTRDVYRIESTAASNPIQNVTISNNSIQTYCTVGDATLTTFIHAIQSGAGDVSNIVVKDSGFIHQSSGYYYGVLCNIEGNPIVWFENCYPDVAFSGTASNLGIYGKISQTVILERVNIDAFPPTGWTAVGTTGGCSRAGGSSGAPAYLRFTGNAGDMAIQKSFTYREYIYDIGSPFISYLVRGTTTPLTRVRVNGQADSDSTTVDATNISRYSNAIQQPTVIDGTTWRRIVCCFKPFADSYDFDAARYDIGKLSDGSAGSTIDITDITVGYIRGGQVPYNPF